MVCPHCSADDTKVVDSRSDPSGRVKRKRACRSCGGRFSTVEWISAENLQVRKRDGRIEPFSRAKLVRSIMKGGNVPGLTPADVNAFVDRVVQMLQPTAPGLPISSVEIGRVVLEQLQDSKPGTDVLRIRYAIVFLGTANRFGTFRGLRDFLSWLEDNYGPPGVAQPETDPWMVMKRGGRVEQYQVAKLNRSIVIAAKGRGPDAEVRKLSAGVGDAVTRELRGQALVTSQQIAGEALKYLLRHDPMTYLRYASAVKRYRSVDDFWMDARALDQR